jgi:nucleotide-binding universal stress UspA family protein
MKAATAKSAIGFRNILFATDFSPAAAQAIPYVKKIAKHYDAALVALHVRTPIISPMTEPGTWAVYLEAAKAHDEQRREELLTTFAGIPTEAAIEEGSIKDCLQSAVEKYDTDLVVIGTHGRTGLGKLLLGSVAEEIFRTVPCPVLTVGPRASMPNGPAGEFHTILYATDFSPESLDGATYAVALAQEFQSRLILLHAMAPQRAGDLVSSADVMATSQKMLRQIVSPEAQLWCHPEYQAVEGNSAEQILEFAKLRDADLIVLGARHEEGVPGAASHLPFATAHRVVTYATCPVLTIRH